MEIRIKDILSEKGMSMKQMCDQMQVNRSSVPIYGKFAPSLSMIARYAKELQVPMWEMFVSCGMPAKEPYTDNDQEEVCAQFGNRLKRIIKDHGLTMAIVAERIGVSAANLSAVAKGNITTSSMEKIATALGIEVWQLFITPEALAAECNRRKALRGEPITLTGEYKPTYSDTHPTPMQKMLNQGARLYFEMERRDKEAAQTPARSMNDSEREPDLFDTIADDAEETEMISVAESKRRMRKALQLLLDNLGRIRPETLDRIIEQACR